MKKFTKRLLTMALALGIVFSMTLPVVAAQPEVIQPRLDGITGFVANLSISTSGKATCGVNLYNNGDYDISVIISLKQDGTTIKTWSVPTDVGSNRIERSYYVTSGHDYQTVATAQLRSGGSLVRSYQISSNVVSY